ncbi:MAG: hypothetical protein ACRDI1_04370, partial [Actinomycetota bacterium]
MTEGDKTSEEITDLRGTVRRMRRVYGSILSMAWEVAKGRSALLVACMVILGLTGAIRALILKFAIDDLAAGALVQAVTMGVVFLVSVGVGNIVLEILSLLQFDMGDRISQEVDHRIMSIVAGLPGLDHLERPEFADKVKLVREQSYI